MRALMSTPLISTQALSKLYPAGGAGRPALRDVDLEVGAGEFVAITGRSGSGKSTLLNLLGLLDRPSGGAYRLDGEETTVLDANARAVRRGVKLGIVFQSYNLLARCTALENVELPLIYADVVPRERRRRALDALAAVGLEGRAERWPSEMSGGEQQRVAIARALVGDPLLLLADEPTGALDTDTGLEMLRLFQTLHRRGRTIVMVTHDREVAAHASRVVVMSDGRIVGERLAAMGGPHHALC